MNRETLLAIIEVRDELVELGWNPNQPRWPKGSGGLSGQWRGTGGLKSMLDAVKRPPRVAGRTPTTRKPPAPRALPPKPKPKADAPVEKPMTAAERKAYNDRIIRKLGMGKKAAEPAPAPKKPLVIPPPPVRRPLPNRKPAPKPQIDDRELDEPAPKPVRVVRTEKPYVPPKPLEERPIITSPEAKKNSPYVSDKFWPFDLSPGHRQHFLRAVNAIDRVHKDGRMTPISIGTKDQNTEGLYSAREFADGTPGGEAYDSIDIKRDTRYPHLVMAHEIGHYIDQRMLGTKDSKWSETGPARLMMAAIGNTKNMQHNKKGRDRAIRMGDQPLAQYYEYLLSDKETFARAYSQWIALRSGEKQMQNQVDLMRGDHVKNYRHGVLPVMQWDWEDFEPVAAAFDNLFKEKTKGF